MKEVGFVQGAVFAVAAVAVAFIPACGSPAPYEGYPAVEFDAVTADRSGGLYVAGQLSGHGTFLGQEVHANFTRSPFILRLDASGKRRWLKLLPTGEGGNQLSTPIDAAGTGDGVVVFGAGAAATRYDGEGKVITTVGFLEDQNLLLMIRPLGAVTSDGAIAVMLDDAMYLTRIDAAGSPAWSTPAASPAPSRLVPDLTGGVWALDQSGGVTRIDALGAHVVVAKSPVFGNGFAAGVAVRDAAGNEQLLVASPTWGTLAFDGAGHPLWSHEGDTADALAADGAGAVTRVVWRAVEKVVWATWMDAAGAQLGRATYPVSLPAGGKVRLMATGTASGALIGGEIDVTDATGMTEPYNLHFLLSAQSSDHSLTALPWED